MATKYESSNPYDMTSIVPSPEAPPSVVRAYLARILIERHEVDESTAHSLVASWKYGLGEELRKPEQKSFIVNFGEDLGPRLYRAVEKDNQRRIKEDRIVWRRTTKFRLTLASVLLTLLCGFLYLLKFQSIGSRKQRANLAMDTCVLNAISFINAACRFNNHEDDLQAAMVLGGVLFVIFSFVFMGVSLGA